MRILLAPILLLSLLTGCATAGKISGVQPGMTREQVVAVMGKPASTSRKGSTEYMNYALSDTSDKAFYGITEPFFVRLVDGRVESFGRTGDFDSTKDPTVNVNTTAKDARPDLYADLMKLKALLDAGAITQAEYDAQKQKLLAR